MARALLAVGHTGGRAYGNHFVGGVWRSGSGLFEEDWWRFCCLRCHSDFCMTCAGQLVEFPRSLGDNAASLLVAVSSHGCIPAGALPLVDMQSICFEDERGDRRSEDAGFS